jgi:hypothetical protein
VIAGAAARPNRKLPPGAVLTWPADAVAATAASTVLRVQLSESDSEQEGWRWRAGRVYVRPAAALPPPPPAVALRP